MTEDVTASVDADMPIKGHSLLLSSKSRERFSDINDDDDAVLPVVIVDDDEAEASFSTF